MRSFCLSLLLLASACRSNVIGTEGTDPVAGIRSGTRLRAVYAHVAEARVLAGWRDLTLGTACNFSAPEASGVSYCVPQAFRVPTGSFADAACTVAVYRAFSPGDRFEASDCAPDIAAVWGSGGRVFTRRGPPPAQVFASTVSGCTLSTEPLDGLHTLGERVPTSAFVAANAQPEAGSARIRQLWLLADDGARAPFGGWDAQRQERVAMFSLVGGALAWLPAVVAYRGPGGNFATFSGDASCSVPVATLLDGRPISLGTQQEPTAVFDVRWPLGCGGPVEAAVFEAGGAADHIYAGTPDSCLPMGPLPTGERFYSYGAPIAASAFEPLGFAAAGQGPVQVRYQSAGGLPILLPAGSETLFDAVTSRSCRVLQSSGRWHCVPAYEGNPVFSFVGPACDRQVLTWLSRATCTLEVPPFLLVQDNPVVGCGHQPQFRVYAIGPTVAGAPSTFDQTGACVPLDLGGQAAQTRELGAEVSASQFPEVTLAVE